MVIPPLRQTEDAPLRSSNEEKVEILRAKFFPKSNQADLSDMDAIHDIPRFSMDITVTENELSKVIRKLPNGKAPGPDGIPNEVWKRILNTVGKELARVITGILRLGELPGSFKESTTVALRKEKKKDYSLPGSYRPIVCENTIAKIVEKVIADGITREAEERGLLLWNQIGARKNRSTLSALELLTGSIQTAWAAKKKVVSVLGPVSYTHLTLPTKRIV